MPICTTVDEIRLAYDVIGRGRHPVAISHGGAGTRAESGTLARHLAERDCTVLTYDARGHGGSSAPHDPKAYDFDARARDLAHLLDHLGWPSAHMIGGSMGAATIVRLALTDANRARTLVLLGPAYCGSRLPEETCGFFEVAATAVDERGVDGYLATVADRLGTSIEQVAPLGAVLREHDPRALAAVLRALARSSPLTGEAQLRLIDVPALIVASTASDEFHPRWIAERYGELMPRGQVLVDPDPAGTHLARPEELAERIAAFFARS